MEGPRGPSGGRGAGRGARATGREGRRDVAEPRGRQGLSCPRYSPAEKCARSRSSTLAGTRMLTSDPMAAISRTMEEDT